MNHQRISFVGAGAFGFALAIHLDRSRGDQIEVRLYDDDRDLLDLLARGEIHPRIAGDLRLPRSAAVFEDLDEALDGADLVVLAVPGRAVPRAAAGLAGRFPADVPLLNVSKALEMESGRRISEIVAEVRGESAPYSTLAGGMIAAELARGRRLGATIAMNDKQQAASLAGILEGPGLYVEASDDVIGVEYAAAFKSVLVIGVGILEGMDCVFGTLTLFLSLASEEAQELAVALGAKRSTFSMVSQCWGNDLLLSAFGSTRNRAYGVAVARALREGCDGVDSGQDRGLSAGQRQEMRRDLVLEVRREMEAQRGTVEGVSTATVLPHLAARAGLEIPRLRAVVDLLEGRLDPDAAAELMLA
jgi:glycerol-3-phosphate dehydrogenase (NAD(P)+)